MIEVCVSFVILMGENSLKLKNKINGRKRVGKKQNQGMYK
jgi:hypothetical protein